MRLTDETSQPWRPRDVYERHRKYDRNKYMAIMRSTMFYALWVTNLNRKKWHTFTPPTGTAWCPPRNMPRPKWWDKENTMENMQRHYRATDRLAIMVSKLFP